MADGDKEMLSVDEVKKRLGRGGVTALARHLKVTKGHLSLVLNGKRRSPHVEAAIAEVIGEPVTRVFPRSAA